ncbi:hypothetical protein GALL_107680 [mine drainage metagenome]|uniref:Uncharacterized protein n=1 Tax=mine drainage metagenome TaxID=410659 RepID=A0A1J5SGY7_9ZZZZ
MSPQDFASLRGPEVRGKLRGFTLVEMIMVMVITGIIAAMVAVFITKPVQGYVDSTRRAEMTDAADTALRRLTRDIRLALPNSLRVTSAGGTSYIEFIMTSAGGRYRDAADGSTAGKFLDFSNAANTSFDVLGPPLNGAIAANDYIVVLNLGPGFSPADAYSGGNIAQVASVAGNTVTLASNPFAAESPPLPSPNDRFQVVPGGVQAVTYACPTGTAGNFTRYWNYGLNATQPTGFASASSALLVGNATCAVSYTANAEQRNGLVSIDLTLSDSSGESVSLFDQIHVDNSP